MLTELDKRNTTTSTFSEPKEGERSLLSSNESGIRSPSLEFMDTSSDTVTDAEVLDYLAHIISHIYLSHHYANTRAQKSSDLLPGVNERTG